MLPLLLLLVVPHTRTLQHRDVFAVLDEPPPLLPSASKPKKRRGKDDAKAAAAEAAAAAAAAAASTVVRIKALDGLGCSTLCPQV
jgi:hypothetical protein